MISEKLLLELAQILKDEYCLELKGKELSDFAHKLKNYYFSLHLVAQEQNKNTNSNTYLHEKIYHPKNR